MLLVFGVAVGQDFEVSPVILEFDAEPAMSQTQIISVKNHSNKKASFLVTIADFIPSQSGEQQVLPPNSTKNSCANWLTINPSFFEINPGGDINIQISMLVPGEEYKTAWCMLYFQPSKEQTAWSVDKGLGAGITVSGRIAVNIYQSPKSLQGQSVKVSNFQEITGDQEGPRRFTATIENLGDRISPCKVFLVASNISTAEEKQFEAINFSIYPRMSRNIELTLPNELTPGTYALAAIVDYGPKFPLEGAQLVIEVK